MNDRDYAALVALAAEGNVRVSDVIRAAVSRHLRAREIIVEAEELIAALHERGLRLVPLAPSRP